MDSPPASPRPPTAPPGPGPMVPSGSGRRNTRRSTRGASPLPPKQRGRALAFAPPPSSPPPPPHRPGALEPSNSGMSSPRQRGRALAFAPPPSSPPPPPSTRAPQPRPREPSKTPDAGRRYPERSTRAPQPRPREPSKTPDAGRRYPERSTRTAGTPDPRGRTPALAPPPPSEAPTPPPLSSSKSLCDAAQDHGSSTLATEEDDKCIKIHMEELHTILDKLGVPDDERKSIINNISNKCLAVYEVVLNSEKDRCLDMVKSISILEAQCAGLRRVLGEKYVLSEEHKVSVSLPKIHESLRVTLMRLNELKKQRLKKLQAMQAKIIDFWDYLGVTLQDQTQYRYLMRNTVASLDEVMEEDALSTGLLSEVQSELTRLEGELMQKITEKFAVLVGNLRQTHLSGDEDYKINFTIIDVKAGRMDLFAADNTLENLIVKSRQDISKREDIVRRAEALLTTVKGSSSYTQEKVENLIDRVNTWESKNQTKFNYDKQRLITLLCHERAKHHDLFDAIDGSPDEQAAAAALRGQSPSWSDSWAEGSEDSESDNPSEDPDFTASQSEDE